MQTDYNFTSNEDSNLTHIPQHYQVFNVSQQQQQISLINSQQIRDKCSRCGNLVYPLERIGPIKGFIYHKTCFKCLKCEGQLDLKTYHTNQIELTDRNIYCRSHAPKSGKGVFGADSFAIQNILNAPKLDIKEKFDNKPKANIDGNARHIVHAVNAQHLIQMRQKDAQAMHHFPAYPQYNPNTIRHIRKAQEVLEAKQREEEDRLLQQFRENRAKEEAKLAQEVRDEWEKRLEAMQVQYEKELKGKKDQRDQQHLTIKFRKDQEDLERNMTIKREKKREDAKRTLLQLEQEATADLVVKHSEEMLKLIKAKEAELNTDSSAGIIPIVKIPPPPVPPLRRKRDLYEDPAVFQLIDEQAINVAESEQTSYTELVDQLTYGLVSDLEKARAIFRWITVKDLNAIEFGDMLSADTPLGLLRGIKYGTETYHTLFMRLCSYAGLHCVDVKGHSKSVGYEPGMKIQPGKFTNTWNAILIDGEWRFVQCNWGARHLVMSKDKRNETTTTVNSTQTSVQSTQLKPTRDKIKYQYDEHYFLPDPEEFILEFYPYRSEWQLLENPISLDEFESLPFVRSLFFHYHLDFVNQRQACILTNQRGACDIKLRMPEDLKHSLAFHFHLRVAQKDDTELNGIKLERYVLHTINDDLVSFNVHVPQNNEYFIEIFASLVDTDTNPFGQSFKLKCICKYKIVCEDLTQRMHPLPSCASGEWGPMKAQRHFNIFPLTHKTAIIEANQSSIELKFELPKSLKIHGKLHNNSIGDLDRYVRQELSDIDGVKCLLTLNVTLPEDGQYGLDVYARDPEYQSEKRTMSHCCKYLINFNKSESSKTTTTAASSLPVPLPPSATASSPREKNVQIGPNNEYLARLGMSPITHTDPLIKSSENKIDIQFKMSKAVDFSFDLKYDSQASIQYQQKTNQIQFNKSPPTLQQLKASEYIKVKQHGYIISFIINLTQTKYGHYIFTIYASDENSNNNNSNQNSNSTPTTKAKNLPAVYTYLIKYDN